jgi:hypothetical protein
MLNRPKLLLLRAATADVVVPDKVPVVELAVAEV